MSSANESGLERQLSARQIAMVAVGGSIGTGLLLGSGSAVTLAGPAVVLSYLLAAGIAWTVTMALGEMASLQPAAGSFGLYGEQFLGRWAGFVARYGYWFAVVTAVSAHLVASATYARYWFPQVPPVGWVVVFAVFLLVLNLRPVGDLGEFEYWFAMIKVVTIVAFIIIGAAMLFGGRIAPQYRAEGGPLPHGWTGPLLAAGFALFSFLGVEMVAISSGEARTAADIPRATRITFALLAFVYLGASAVLVGVVPWNMVGAAESPFVTVFSRVGLRVASSVMNFVVLTAALSSANANLYVAARMIFSLARGGYAPHRLGELDRAGEPRAALAVSFAGIAIAVVAAYVIPEKAFLYIIAASLFGGMVAWWVGLAAHVSFRRTVDPATLPIRSFLGPAGSILGFIALTAAMLGTWWTPLWIALPSGAVLLAVLTIGYFAVSNADGRKP